MRTRWPSGKRRESARIVVRNFKSIGNATLLLRRGLNVLVGPNGAGKTCLLSSLQFLRDLLRHGAVQALARSGGAKRVYRRGHKDMEFSVETNSERHLTFRKKRRPMRLVWSVTIRKRSADDIGTITAESVELIANVGGVDHRVFAVGVDRSGTGEPSYTCRLAKVEDMSKDIMRPWAFGYSDRERKESVYKSFRSSLRSMLRSVKKLPDRSLLPYLASFHSGCENVLSLFTFLNEYNLLPDLAREPTEPFPFAQMRPDGSRVSEVIHALETKNYRKIYLAPEYDMELDEHVEMYRYQGKRYAHDFGSKRAYMMHRRRGLAGGPIEKVLPEINSEMTSAVGTIDEVSARIDPTTGKRFVVFKSGKNEFYPEEVSDGTIKWLCLLVSILVPYSRVYLLEEPENFLHPWMQQRLVEMMREQSRRQGTVFILTSHSATVLNAALPEEISIVRQRRRGTEIHDIEELGDVKRMLKESAFGLGDLWVSGGLGGVPSDA